MKNNYTFPIFVSLCLCFLMSFSSSVYSEALSPSLKVESATQAQSRKTQKRVDQWSADTERLLMEYQRITQQLDYQRAYALELEQKLVDQDQEIAELEKAIADIQITRLHLLPLLREMVDTLRQFIELDLPFEQAERLAAVDQLDALLGNSQVSIAEKFQRVMELYQTENDYNYNLSSYREMSTIDGQAQQLEFLRVGRLALYYRSLNADLIAMWSVDEKKWVDVSQVSGAKASLDKAIRVAKELQAPELLELPVDYSALAAATLTEYAEGKDDE